MKGLVGLTLVLEMVAPRIRMGAGKCQNAVCAHVQIFSILKVSKLEGFQNGL